MIWEIFSTGYLVLKPLELVDLINIDMFLNLSVFKNCTSVVPRFVHVCVHAKLLQSWPRFTSGQIRLYYICCKLVSKENNETLNVNKLLVKLASQVVLVVNLASQVAPMQA